MIELGVTTWYWGPKGMGLAARTSGSPGYIARDDALRLLEAARNEGYERGVRAQKIAALGEPEDETPGAAD